MKPGYSLIELTIGILLASLLAISLFQSVRTTTTSVELADDIMDLDIRAATFHHQFGQDTIGIFTLEKQDKKEQSVQQGDKDKKEKDSAKPNQEKQVSEKKEKLPDKQFYSINNEEGRLAEFTFITSNPVSVYQKAKNVTVKPRMVRVMYRLLAQPNNPHSFTLFRQETENLDIQAVDSKAEKPIRAYALLSNIKKMSLEFSYPVRKEVSKEEVKPSLGGPGKLAQQEKDSESMPEIEKIETRKDWPFKTLEEAHEKKVPASPQIITAKFELWDNTGQGSREFVLQYPIVSFTLFEKKKKKTQSTPALKAPVRAGNAQEGIAQGKKRIEVSVKLKPKTEERLASIGGEVFKFALEGKAKVPMPEALEQEKLLAQKVPVFDDREAEELFAQLEQLFKSQKSAL